MNPKADSALFDSYLPERLYLEASIYPNDIMPRVYESYPVEIYENTQPCKSCRI